MKLTDALSQIKSEYLNASSHFPPMKSPHEGLSIIEEEFEELKAEVFKQHHVRTIADMQKEAKQVAAMALRFMVDLT
jgi:hypothetical protein